MAVRSESGAGVHAITLRRPALGPLKRVCLGLAVVAAGSFGVVAQAATYSVTSLADSGAGTLREAIDKANASAGADTIAFAVNGTINLETFLPIVTDALTIQGNGPDSTIISGQDKTRILVTASSLTLTHLTLTQANSTFAGDPYYSVGGAVLAAPGADLGVGPGTSVGNVTLDDVLVSDNKGMKNAGVLQWDSSPGATLTIRNSTFKGNQDQPSVDSLDLFLGSAVRANGASLVIEKSVFRSNSGNPTVVADRSPTVRVDQSVFSGNSVNTTINQALTNCGAVVCAFSLDPAAVQRAQITRSLFQGNTAPSGPNSGDGGLNIVSVVGYPAVEVVNNTFTGNTIALNSWLAGVLLIDASSAAQTTVAFNTLHGNNTVDMSNNAPGAGLVLLDATGYSDASSAQARWLVSSNIIDDSLLRLWRLGPSPEMTVLRRNILGGMEGEWQGDWGTGNLSGYSNPVIGSLAANGAQPVGAMGHQASADSFMPLAGSPAIDSGFATDAPAVDQPGMARPAGAGPEIGAVEMPVTPPPAPTPAVTGATVTVGDLAPQTVVFTPDGNSVTLTFDISSLLKTGSVLITAVPQLLDNACGCLANTLTRTLRLDQPAPTPVPTLSQLGLAALAGLMLVAALRGGAGRRGIKVLATAWLGIALVHPAHDLRAADANALAGMTVSVSGNTLTVTLTRNPACAVSQPPVLPSPIVLTPSWWAERPWQSFILPAASDAEGDALTYSLSPSPLPAGMTFDPSTRTLVTGDYNCRDASVPDQAMSMRLRRLADTDITLEYSAADRCNAPVKATLTCKPNGGGEIPI